VWPQLPGGCDNEACNIPALAEAKAQGFVKQDYELFVEEWGSVYVMVDSVGDHDPQPAQQPKHPGDPSQGKYLLTEWSNLIRNKTTGPPVILHSCHVVCSASYFYGPTLRVSACNKSDPRQQFELGVGVNSSGTLSDAGTGLCAGCLHVNTGCGNTALKNASGLGYGMQGCSGQGNFYFNQSTAGGADAGMIMSKPNGCLVLAQQGKGPQVVLEPSCPAGVAAASGWKIATTVAGPPGRADRAQYESETLPGQCLSVGPSQSMPIDPWCTEDVNMFRSNTDSLQVWGRMMDELESLVGMGSVSQPGSWAFPDYMQLGVPMVGSLTWEESKTLLSIWAVSSAPLIISNDVRPGRVQQRILNLFLNKDMLRVSTIDNHAVCLIRLIGER
jgi:hypothetical protein